MECNKATSELIDYLYGELSDKESQKFKHHLSTCSSCQKELAELNSTHKLLQKSSAPLPDSLFIMNKNSYNRFHNWWRNVTLILPNSIRGRLSLGVAVFLIIFMFIGSLTKLQIQYSNAHFSISMGTGHPIQNVAMTQAQKDALVAQLQNQNYKILNAWLQNEQQKQLNQIKKIMTDYSYALQEQQNENFHQIGQELNTFYKHTNRRFMQTNNVLSDIMQTVQYNNK
jgi:uncharacterized protein YacL (UPF0231 family)